MSHSIVIWSPGVCQGTAISRLVGAVLAEQSGRQIGPPDEHTNITSAAFSPDGRYLAYAKNGDLRIVDMTLGHTVKELSYEPGVRYLAYRTDGTQMLAVVRDKILVLDADSGQVLAEMPDARGVEAAIFSPDDRYIISSFSDTGGLRIWDADTHLTIGDLTGREFISNLAISDDNRRIVADDGLWLGRAA